MATTFLFPVDGDMLNARDGVERDRDLHLTVRLRSDSPALAVNGRPARREADGTITLDFNRAVLPPCAFSYAFNCPMPPKQNRFPFPIEAGEKLPLDKAGAPLH